MQPATVLFHGFFPVPKLMVALLLQSLITHFSRTTLAILRALTVICTLVVPQSTSDLEYVLKTPPGFEMLQIQHVYNSPSSLIESDLFSVLSNVICDTI